MLRVTTVWSGFVGSPGYTNHYFEEAIIAEAGAWASVANVHAFFNSVAPFMPSTVHLDVLPAIAQIDEATGNQTGEIANPTTPTTIVGGDGNAYAAPSGAAVNWSTSTFVAGHRLRGRTFLVPLGRSAWDADGSLASAALTALRSAGVSLASPVVPLIARLLVWHRPKAGAPGSLGLVTSSSVKDKAAILTSRRD